MNDRISQSPHDYDFDGDEVGTNHYDMMVVTIHREREAQAKQRQQINATQGVAIGVEETEGQGRTLLLNLDPYYEVMVVVV